MTAELEVAAMYERLGNEANVLIDDIKTTFSRMSGPELFGATAECVTDCLIIGKLFRVASWVVKNASLRNMSVGEYLAGLSQETGAPICDAHNLIELAEKYPQEFGLDASRIAKTEQTAAAVSKGSQVVAENVRWGMWRDLPKEIYKGREYAKINGRLYTREAVDRMTPKGFGKAVDGYKARGIPTNVIEDVINNGKFREVMTGGVNRSIFEQNGIRIVTEENGKIVVTAMRYGN